MQNVCMTSTHRPACSISHHLGITDSTEYNANLYKQGLYGLVWGVMTRANVSQVQHKCRHFWSVVGWICRYRIPGPGGWITPKLLMSLCSASWKEHHKFRTRSISSAYPVWGRWPGQRITLIASPVSKRARDQTAARKPWVLSPVSLCRSQWEPESVSTSVSHMHEPAPVSGRPKCLAAASQTKFQPISCYFSATSTDSVPFPFLVWATKSSASSDGH